MTKTRTGNSSVDAIRWNAFAKWIKQKRREKGLSQADAATAAGWSVTTGRVSWCRYEAGEPARIETVTRIAKGLGVDENDALHMAGYLSRTNRITVSYKGPDIVGIALAITSVVAEFKVNATRTCMEGAEGISGAFVQMTGTVETTDVQKLSVEIDGAIRSKISQLFREFDNSLSTAPPAWNLSVFHNPPEYGRKYKQIFDFRVVTENQPGEIHKVVEFFTQHEKLDIIFLSSVQTPLPLAYSVNIGQCGHVEGVDGDVDTELLTRRLAHKLRISGNKLDDGRIEFRPARTIYSRDFDFQPEPIGDQTDGLALIPSRKAKNKAGLTL